MLSSGSFTGSPSAPARWIAVGAVMAALGLPSSPAVALEIRGPASGPKAAILRLVADAATCVLKLARFRAELRARTTFRESDHSGAQVLAAFDEDRVCYLSTYRRGGAFGHFMYWDRVDAMHRPGTEVVRFNLNTFREEDLAFLVGTAIHECAHFLGYRHSKNDRFRHPEIVHTVPYQVGFLAEKHAPICLGDAAAVDVSLEDGIRRGARGPSPGSPSAAPTADHLPGSLARRQ